MKKRGSFSISPAQRFEYMFARSSATASWSSRAMILNIETGVLMEYAEKSGRKVLKERYNVKGCDLVATESVVSDKERTMTIILSDKRELHLAYEEQDHFDEWLEYFKSFSDAFRLVAPVVPEQPKPKVSPSPATSPRPITPPSENNRKPNTTIESRKQALSAVSHPKAIPNQPRRKSDKESARVSFSTEEPMVMESEIIEELAPEIVNNASEDISPTLGTETKTRSLSIKDKYTVNDGVHDMSPTSTIYQSTIGSHASSVNVRGSFSETFDEEIIDSDESTQWPPQELKRNRESAKLSMEDIYDSPSSAVIENQRVDFTKVPQPTLAGDEIKFSGENPLARQRKVPQTIETVSISSRVHSSPFEQASAVSEQYATALLSPGSSLVQGRVFGSSISVDEFEESSPEDSKAEKVEDPDKTPHPMPPLSKQNDNHDPKMNADRKPSLLKPNEGIAMEPKRMSINSAEKRPSLGEKRPSLGRIGSPDIAHSAVLRSSGLDSPSPDKVHEDIRKLAEASPLGEKRRPSERRPSLSETLFGFEISTPTSKLTEKHDSFRPEGRSFSNEKEKPVDSTVNSSNDSAKVKPDGEVNLKDELKSKLAAVFQQRAGNIPSPRKSDGKSVEESSPKAVKTSIGSSFHDEKRNSLSAIVEESVVAEDTKTNIAIKEKPNLPRQGSIYKKLFTSIESNAETEKPVGQKEAPPQIQVSPVKSDGAYDSYPSTPILSPAPSSFTTASRNGTISETSTESQQQKRVTIDGPTTMNNPNPISTITETRSQPQKRVSIGAPVTMNQSNQPTITSTETKNEMRIRGSIPSIPDAPHDRPLTQMTSSTSQETHKENLASPSNGLPNPLPSPNSIKVIARRASSSGESLNPIAVAAAVALERNLNLSELAVETEQNKLKEVQTIKSHEANNKIDGHGRKSHDESKLAGHVGSRPSIPTTHTPSSVSTERIDTGNDHLLIEVVGIVHPAHRLNRRVHIWNYSYGFSFEAIEDLHQFIYDMRESDDNPLVNLSYCTQDTFLDWSETMNALREQEAKFAAELFNENIELLISVAFMVGEEKVAAQNYRINYHDTPSDIAAKIVTETGFDYEFIKSQIIQEVVKENNFYQQGYAFLQKTMLFAEDLFLYQEEIIDTLSRERADLQQQLQQAEEAAQTAMKVAEENVALVNQYKSNEKTEEERRISDINTKEQWEKEKDEIVRNHELEKVALTNELRLVRQSSDPSADKIFADLRRNEMLLGSLEDQLVKSEMANDQLKVQLQIASERIERAELEKAMMEKEHQDQLAAVRGIGSQYGPNKAYYPIDSSVGESKDNKGVPSSSAGPPPAPPQNFANVLPSQLPTTNKNFFTKDPQGASIKYYTPGQQQPSSSLDKSMYNLKKNGISTFTGDLHPYLKFSSDPADITKPRSPTQSRLGKLKSNTYPSNNYSSPPQMDNYAESNPYQTAHMSNMDPGRDSYYNQSQPNPMSQNEYDYDDNNGEQSTISNDDGSNERGSPGYSSSRKLSPAELTRLLATRHLNGFVKNDNHPLRQALRQEMPQISNIQKQKEEEARKSNRGLSTNPSHQVIRSGHMSNRDLVQNMGDRYMEATDSSNKKSREASENYYQIRRQGTVAWKV